MLSKTLTRHITGRTEGSGGGNTVSFNSYSDRSIAADEILWSHTVPQDCTIPKNATGSVATVTTGTDATIDILLNDVSVGQIQLGVGSTEGVFLVTDAVPLLEGDIIKIKAVTDVSSTDLSISILGAIL